MKKVYIAGPISNLPILDAQRAFLAAETKLLALGLTVVNPMKLPHLHNKEWESYMKEDLREMLTCDLVVMLKGWQNSRGAVIEFNLAHALKIKVLFFEQIN